MLTGPSVTLNELVAETVRWCDRQVAAQNHDLELMIYCHGSAGFLQLSREGVTLGNAHKLAPLEPYFDIISIHACRAARGQAGRALCTRLAHVMRACVAAAVEAQDSTGPQVLYSNRDDRGSDGEYYLRFYPAGRREGVPTSR